mmetsp:Transcript_22022/g.52642  ORF Transcript_22022/g.52642 Transcript_22022/m.52642 type:complete len:205 (+) Transcript_22022:172-786(+)
MSWGNRPFAKRIGVTEALWKLCGKGGICPKQVSEVLPRGKLNNARGRPPEAAAPGSHPSLPCQKRGARDGIRRLSKIHSVLKSVAWPPPDRRRSMLPGRLSPSQATASAGSQSCRPQSPPGQGRRSPARPLCPRPCSGRSLRRPRMSLATLQSPSAARTPSAEVFHRPPHRRHHGRSGIPGSKCSPSLRPGCRAATRRRAPRSP